MRNVKNIVMLAALAATTSIATAADFPVSAERVTIPKPPIGERWILNDQYSDEFNGDKLDENKWVNGATIWSGRPPGLFVEENVAVGDGYLKIKGGTLDQPIIKGEGDDAQLFTLSCGSIGSKDAFSAHYGYYEAKVKANKTSLSTTFWLSTRGNRNNPVREGQPESMQDGVYHQELDFCETVGRGGTAEEGWKNESSNFHKGMNSNAHCWLTPATGGGQIDLVIPKLPGARPADGSVLSDDFNIYGCLWPDKTGAEFFLNNVSNGGHIDFVSRDGKEFWMTQPMAMNIWVETYNWIPTPLNEDLSDPNKNTSYYDWIRHYVLVEIDEEVANVAPAQSEIFEDYIHFTNRKSKGSELELIYTSPADRSIIVEIYTLSGKIVGSNNYNALSGFGADSYSVDSAKLKSGKKYVAVAYLVEAGAKSSDKYLCGDSFEFTAN